MIKLNYFDSYTEQSGSNLERGWYYSAGNHLGKNRLPNHTYLNNGDFFVPHAVFNEDDKIEYVALKATPEWENMCAAIVGLFSFVVIAVCDAEGHLNAELIEAEFELDWEFVNFRQWYM